MSNYVPDVLYAYSPLESDNLKEPLTALPVALTARALSGAHQVTDPPVDSEPNTPYPEDAQYVRSSFDDWYYRIHVIPARLALGVVAGDVQRAVLVWNAFFGPKTLEDFTLTAGQGITYSSSVVPPEALPPLEDVTYALRVSVDGPSVIDAEAVWTVDGVEYAVPITGQRSVLFGFRPNWGAQRVNETYEWLNTVTTTYSGYEQVMAARHVPRRILDYQMRLHDAEVRRFDESAFGWTGRTFSLPWWPERTKLTQPAEADDTVVYLDTVGRSFAANSTALLVRDATDYDILDIAEVHDDRLVLNNSLPRAWPVAAYVCPVLPAIPQADFSTRRASSTHLDVAARFVLSPTEAVLNLPEQAAPMAYRGYEMYFRETNWRSPLGINLSARRKEVDSLYGPIASRRKSDFPVVMRGFSWLLKTRAQARDLLAFFVRRAGRRVPVWMPSGVDDFRLLEDVPSGQNSIIVERSEAGRLIGINEARRDLIFILRTGEPVARRILAIEDEGANTQITFTESFDDAMPLSNVKRISWLGLYRLASDSVTFAWATDEVAEVEVNFLLKKDRDP